MQITWSWPPVGRFSHVTWLPEHKRKWEHKVVRLMWDFDCLRFAQYISMGPHGIGCKQTWCKKIYHMNRARWLSFNLKPLMLVFKDYRAICALTSVVRNGGMLRQFCPSFFLYPFVFFFSSITLSHRGCRVLRQWVKVLWSHGNHPWTHKEDNFKDLDLLFIQSVCSCQSVGHSGRSLL